MARISAVARSRTKEAVGRLAELGQTRQPYELAAHLALRYAMRNGLFRAFHAEPGDKWLLCGPSPQPTPWPLSDDALVTLWCYVSCQTHFPTESVSWLVLPPCEQLELCRWFALRRAGEDDLMGPRGCVVPKHQPGATYVVIRGSALLSDARHDDDATEQRRRASDEVDSAMFDEPVVREERSGEDWRLSSHVFGSLRLPADLRELADAASGLSDSLRSFMSLEADRARQKGVFKDERKETPPPSPEKEASFDEAPKPAEEDVIDYSPTLTDDDRAAVQEILSISDGFDKNQLLSRAEIDACLTQAKYRDFKRYLLSRFHLFDANCDGELERVEVEIAVANFAKRRCPPETEPAAVPICSQVDELPYEFGEDDVVVQRRQRRRRHRPVEDWTWTESFVPAFSVDTEYLTLEVPDVEAEAMWARARATTENEGVPGRLSAADTLELRARGLGFLCSHAVSRELCAGQVLCEEGEVPTEMFLVLEGIVEIERLRELTSADDSGVHAAKREGLFLDSVGLATIPAPLLVNDLPLVLELKESPMRAACATRCRALAVSISAVRRLLAHHEPERRALVINATLRSIWLDERRSARCALRREGRQLSSTPRCVELGRYWHLWSAAAALTEPLDRVKWLERLRRPLSAVTTAHSPASPAFFAGSVLTKAEIERARHARKRAPRGEAQSTEAKLRERAAVAVVVAGTLGSFVAPGVFDNLPVQSPPQSVQALQEIVPPTSDALRRARAVPLLAPFPTATRARHLHGRPLPIGLEKLTSTTISPQDRRSAAAVAVARERSGTAPTRLRDARHEIARYRALFLACALDEEPLDDPSPASPLVTRFRRRRFGPRTQPSFDPPPVVLDGDHDSRLQAGLPHLAGHDVEPSDRADIQSAVKTALAGLPATEPVDLETLDEQTDAAFIASSASLTNSLADFSNGCSGLTPLDDRRLEVMRSTKRAALARRRGYARLHVSPEHPDELCFDDLPARPPRSRVAMP